MSVYILRCFWQFTGTIYPSILISSHICRNEEVAAGAIDAIKKLASFSEGLVRSILLSSHLGLYTFT